MRSFIETTALQMTYTFEYLIIGLKWKVREGYLLT